MTSRWPALILLAVGLAASMPECRAQQSTAGSPASPPPAQAARPATGPRLAPAYIVNNGRLTPVTSPMRQPLIAVTRAPGVASRQASYPPGGGIGTSSRATLPGPIPTLGGVRSTQPNVLGLSPSAPAGSSSVYPPYGRPGYRSPYPTPIGAGTQVPDGLYVGSDGIVYSNGGLIAGTGGFSYSADYGSLQIALNNGAYGQHWNDRDSRYGAYCRRGWGSNWGWYGYPYSYYSGWSYYTDPIYGYAPTYPSSVVDPNLTSGGQAASQSSTTSQAAPPAPMDLAQQAMQGREYGAAAAYIRQHLGAEPYDALAWRWLGMALLKDRKYKDGVIAIDRAYALEKQLTDLPIEYGAMGLTLSDIRELCGPVIMQARRTRTSASWLTAALLMELRGMQEKAAEYLTLSERAGAEPALIKRLRATVTIPTQPVR